MKKKKLNKTTKILLGALIGLIAIILCWVISINSIVHYNSNKHTLSAIAIYNINSLVDENFERNDEDEEQARKTTITEKEFIEYLEKLKEQGKLEKYEVGEASIGIYLVDYGYFLCRFDLPDGYQGASSNSNTNRSKGTVSLSANKNSLLVLSAQPCDDIESDIFDNSASVIENADLGYEFTDNIDLSNVTLEFMKTLSKYRVIIWNGHGGYNEDNGIYSFQIGETWTNENYKKYSKEESAGRVVRYMDGGVGITAKFINDYYEDDSFNDTLIYLGSCHLGEENSAMVEAFINKGAEAVLAYKNTVYSDYNQKMCETIFNELVKQDGDTGSTKTVAEALETAKKQNGEKDPTTKEWYYKDTSKTEWYDKILNFVLPEKSDRAELILTENDDNSFRLVDNTTNKNVDYKKIYYQYIKDNLDIIDYDKFPDDENNTGVFSALIEDFDNDKIKEMVTFSYENKSESQVALNLYKYLDGKVTLCDTSKEKIYASGAGNFSENMCGIFEDKTIKIQSDGYSYGGSYHYSAYMSYKVKDNKLVCANNYSLYVVPKYETYEYKENVSGKTYSNENDFTSAVKTAGYGTETHLHAGYTDSKFNPETDDYENNKLFKGNHIFTLINSNSFIKSGIYGFLNDNTNLKNQLGISSSSNETTTAKRETTTKGSTTTTLKNDISIFEDMIDETSWVWLSVENFNFEKATAKDVINTYYIFCDAMGPELYNHFFDDSKRLEKDPKGKFEFGCYKFSADNFDWILENIFEVKPNRNITSDLMYYSGDYCYYQLIEGGGGFDYSFKTNSVYNLGNETYGIIIDLKISPDEGNERTDKCYFVTKLKKDNNKGKYWSIIQFSKNKKIFNTSNKIS